MKPLFSLLLFLNFLASAQEKKISGQILGQDDNLPIQSVTVKLKLSGAKTVTDLEGRFVLPYTFLPDSLEISHVGYMTRALLISDRMSMPLTFLLSKSIGDLSGVTVYSTGYQEIPKERATGSFEMISPKLINRSVSTDIISRLEGVSSIYFDKRGDGYGEISVRGRSTLYSNAKPLIIVDNFPYDGDIGNINPNDVESITLLKDAAAASIWGVRAGNGVIVITTKKAKANRQPQIEFNVNTTIIDKPDLFKIRAMAPGDFIDMEKSLFADGHYQPLINVQQYITYPLSPVVELLAAKQAGTLDPATADAQIEALKSHDVRSDFERYFYRKGINQQYALSIQGGSDRASYLLSAGYDRVTGQLVGNRSERFTIRSMNNFNLNAHLKAQAGLRFTQTNAVAGNNQGYGGISSGYGYSLYPYARLADDAGNALPIIKDHRLSYDLNPVNDYLLDWQYKPLADIPQSRYKNQLSDLVLNTALSYQSSRNWTADIRYQLEYGPGNTTLLHGKNSYYARNIVNKFTQTDPVTNELYRIIPAGAVLQTQYSKLISHQLRAELGYHKNCKNQELNVIAGAEVKQLNTNAESGLPRYGYDPNTGVSSLVDGYNEYFPYFDNRFIYNSIPQNDYVQGTAYRFLSFFANAAYSFRAPNTFTVSGRRDASNLFGVSANQKFVPLYSAGLNWEINKEKFYTSTAIPYLKLRLSWGYNGNINNSRSALTTINYQANALFTFGPYARIQNPPNPKLRWERTSVLNLGLDFGSRNSRITGRVEYYTKKGMDLIGQAPVEPTTGVMSNLGDFSYWGNVASMRGQGMEIQINSENLKGQFKWTTSVLFNHVRTKLTRYELPDPNSSNFVSDGVLINPIPGKPLYSVYSYAWAGLDPTNGDPQGIIKGQLSTDYSTILTGPVTDLVYHGSAVPVTFGSFMNTFQWKNLSLSFNILFKLGYYFRKSSINYNSLVENWAGHEDYSRRWQKPGDEQKTNVPSFLYPAPDPNRETFYNLSSTLVEKGDHIRFQDISLSYEPANLKKWPLRQIRLYVYVSNLGLLWKANHSGLDPDYASGGYPLPTAWSFGIKTGF